jgi:hypothetical protein
MTTTFSSSASNPLNSSLMVLGAMIAVPAGLALHAIHSPVETKPIPPDPRPYRYTVCCVHYSDQRDRMVVCSTRRGKNS